MHIELSCKTAKLQRKRPLRKSRRRWEENITIYQEPVPMAAWSKSRTVFDRSNIGIVGSNTARGMDVCPRFPVLCCPV
jgi:hypothetical protein